MSAGIKANNDGSGAIQIGGSDYIQIGSTGNVTIPQNLAVTGAINSATGALYPLVSGTATASTSGTAVNFDNVIPATAKRITVMFQGVSTNGTGIIQVQLGTGTTPTYTITGYLGAATSTQTTSPVAANYTTGFGLTPQQAAAAIHHGVMTISLVSASTNAWAASSTSSRSDLAQSGSSAGSIALAAALTSVRVIGSATGNPADTFDAGTINIMWE